MILVYAPHGGYNPGALSSTTDLREADVNLIVVMYLGELLLGLGYDVNYTRTENVDVTLTQRANMANEAGADYFISVHCNSSVSPEAKGTETFYYKKNTTAERLAKNVQQSLVNRIQQPDRGVDTANFAVLRKTYMPAILVELAFISNPEESLLLGNTSFQQSCAKGISEGIQNFLNNNIIPTSIPRRRRNYLFWKR